MPKTCNYGLKSSNKICKYALNTPLLEYIFVKRNVRKNGRGFCAFSSAITSRLFLRSYIFVKRNVHKKRRGCCAFSSAITGGTGEFMYKASILGMQ